MTHTTKRWQSENRGEKCVIYSKEAFRHTFKNPIPATFQLIVEGEKDDEIEFSNKGACIIVDLSPSGIRMYSKLDIPQRPGY